MSTMVKSRLPKLLRKHESELLADWINEQKSSLRQDRMKGELREQCSGARKII